jgi:hypothetical protein
MPKAVSKNENKPQKPKIKSVSFYNQIHKKLIVIYGGVFTDMRELWKQVRRDFRKETHIILPKSLKKNPDEFALLMEWVETKIENEGKNDQYFLNKSDLVDRGWNTRIIEKLYPKPLYVLYLGRGRYVYYYDGNRASELEDSEDFIEYIEKKIERQRRRNQLNTGFGSEFIR